VARNADRGIDVVLDSVLGGEEGAREVAEPGTGAITDSAAPTVTDSASEGADGPDSVTFDLDSDDDGADDDNADDDNTDNDSGGNE
jgi:hypothetical protein